MTSLSLAEPCKSIERDCHWFCRVCLKSEAGLKINPKKCKLLSERVVVLGHVVTQDGISTDPEKLRVIKMWPVPEDESQLKAFLGTASYYRQLVPNYADIAAPLQIASQKGECFRWTTQC